MKYIGIAGIWVGVGLSALAGEVVSIVSFFGFLATFIILMLEEGNEND